MVSLSKHPATITRIGIVAAAIIITGAVSLALYLPQHTNHKAVAARTASSTATSTAAQHNTEPQPSGEQPSVNQGISVGTAVSSVAASPTSPSTAPTQTQPGPVQPALCPEALDGGTSCGPTCPPCYGRIQPMMIMCPLSAAGLSTQFACRVPCQPLMTTDTDVANVACE